MTGTPNPVPRSTFVTVVAWVFIVSAGFATLIGILQNIMIALMFAPEVMREVENSQDVGGLERLLVSYPHIFFGAFLVLVATTFVSAIGLLKRKNWARLTFVGVMMLGVLWNLGGVVVMAFTPSFSMPTTPGGAPQEFHDDFEIMWKVMMVFSAFISLAFASLFAWIVKRLLSQDVKREFLAP